MKPGSPRIEKSRTALGIIATIAAIGTSSLGPLDLVRRTAPGRIDTGGPTRFDTPGLELIGADDEQVDVLDLATNHTRTWPVGGVVDDRAEPNLITRVTGGWLVVRDNTVVRVTDRGSSALVGKGSRVFAANHGRDAWIATEAYGLQWSVAPYNPQTGRLGPSTSVGPPVAAVDRGLMVSNTHATLAGGVFGTSAFDIVDAAGRVLPGPLIDSVRINILTAGGNRIALVGAGGLYVLDLATNTNRLISNRMQSVALSPNGSALAWIEHSRNRRGGRVMAMRISDNHPVEVGAFGDRVLVADDGTVLFTNGFEIRRARVDRRGSTVVSGLALDPNALLALG